jgi:hypothetical protein
VSVSVFFYTDPRPGVSAAERGYAAVQEELTALLGPPLEETSGGSKEASSFWVSEDLSVELCCHYQRVDSLEVSLEHMDRKKDYEALPAAESGQP